MGQLITGVRYLDLRVSYQSTTTEKWWINHGLVILRPLAHIFQQVKTFLTHTNEIVILDFHELIAGKKDILNFIYRVGIISILGSKRVDKHQEMVQYLKSELSEWLASPNWSSTCGELWKSNKTLIVAYNYPEIVANHSSFLWSPVHHHWANAQDRDELRSYLDQIIKT